MGLVPFSHFILFFAVRALRHHHEINRYHLLSEPPLMELGLVALAVAGLLLVFKHVPPRPYLCAFMFSVVLTTLALFGLWYSEILYDRTVIYSFYTNTHKATALLP
jgi:hypothetical protein